MEMIRWSETKLSDFLTLRRGHDLAARERRVGVVPVVTSAGIGDYHDTAKVKGPGVITGRYGTIGQVFYIEQDFWPLNTTLFVSDFKGNSPLFAYFLLQMIDFESHSGKSGVPGVNRNDIHELAIRYPSSRAEQTAVANALSDMDGLISGLERLIAKKRAIKEGAMQELLTGRVRLEGFGEGSNYQLSEIGLIPEDWFLRNVEDFASVTTGNRNTQDRKEDGQYPFFVRSQKVEQIDSYSFDGEAILTAGDGVGTGKVFHYYNGKFDFHQRVYKISNFEPGIHGYYFFIQFSSRFLERIMSMTAKSSVDSVRKDMIGKMLIPTPSFEEQSAIAQILSDMDAEITAMEAKLEKYRLVKEGMMEELLRGKTRLL